MIQPGQVLVVKRELGLSKRLQDDPALAADLVQMGIDQTSPCLAAPPDDDRRNRCCESSSVSLPSEQLPLTVTNGTPGQRLVFYDAAIRDGRIAFVRDDGEIKRGFVGGFVEAGKHHARVCA